MNGFADASFLLAVAGDDVHTAKAAAFLAKHSGTGLRTTAMVVFECRNRLHKWKLAGEMTVSEFDRTQLHLDALISQRFIYLSEVSLRSLHAGARRLIEHFSPKIPHGALDLLHVAAAAALRCEAFVTFDRNQRGVAAAAGLRLPVSV